MKNKLLAFALASVFLLSCGRIGEKSVQKEKTMKENILTLHPVPEEIRDGGQNPRQNNDFSVSVRLPGGDWQDLFTYLVRVDGFTYQGKTDHNLSDASMVQFDFSGTVEMRITPNSGTLNTAVIRPLSKGVQPVIENGSLSFFLSEPAKLSVEINGDRFHNLHVFANPPETEIPDPEDPDVIYFGEGVHSPAPRDFFSIPSNKTVYLAPGAVLRGKIMCHKVENVRITGRGIILQSDRGFEITFSKNIEIDGITVINPSHYTVFGGQTTGLKIKNLKSFSSQIWSDGIDLMSCSDVTIEDVFMRNSDDCIAIYGHRWDYYGDVKNYTVKNAILWADAAHPINIGLHGNTTGEGEYIENLRFSNIDILEHDFPDPYYQGCMAFSVGDFNLVRDVVFDNIRIEEISRGMLCNLRILYSTEWHTGPGRGIENIVFRNIFCDYSTPPDTSVIYGYDEGRLIRDVRFENIVIKGKRAQSFEEANIRVGKFTENITIQ
jgi:hypothetical protein